MFRGAICLQPYDRKEYADKISGITLDALAAAAPVVPSANTWMAHTIQRFAPVVVVPDALPATLERAVLAVIHGYARYSGMRTPQMPNSAPGRRGPDDRSVAPAYGGRA